MSIDIAGDLLLVHCGRVSSHFTLRLLLAVSTSAISLFFRRSLNILAIIASRLDFRPAGSSRPTLLCPVLHWLVSAIHFSLQCFPHRDKRSEANGSVGDAVIC